MSAADSLLAQFEASLANIFAAWDTYSTLIATFIVVYLGYSLFNSKDPDTHPFLLARQATEAPVRQPGESAPLRALDVPHGYPLKSGLNVKDADAPKWTSGRNGDLRDIWRAALRGGLNPDGTPTGKKGKIYTVLGKVVKEHTVDEISQHINILGQYISDSKCQTVAISLSDSVELLAAIFAGAFYGFKTVIIPHNLPSEKLAAYLKQAKADLLIAEAGAVDLSVLLKGAPGLKHTIWVAKAGNRHMDWKQVPDGIGGDIEVAEWHDLVEDKQSSVGSDLPTSDQNVPTHPLVTLWPSTTDGRFIEYTQGNLVSAIAALGSALPRNERLTSSDLLLTIDSLSRSYPLCLTLAALYVNASIALNSVAGEGVDFALASASISPTIIVASSQTISDYHAKYMAPHTGLFARIGKYFQKQSLDAGNMPTSTIFTKLANIGPTAELSLDKLRLLFISERADGDARSRLSSDQLTDLRIFTGARVLYALTAATVAGAVCQTNAYDYRRHPGPSHFGPPLSSLQITLRGHAENEGQDRVTQGEIYASGPAVVSGSSALGVQARLGDDNTISIV